MADKVEVPARIIYQMDFEIQKQAARIAKLGAHLEQLRATRAVMVAIDPPTHGKATGGHARAKSLTAERRSAIASDAAKARWQA